MKDKERIMKRLDSLRKELDIEIEKGVSDQHITAATIYALEWVLEVKK